MADENRDEGLWQHCVRFDAALKGLSLDLSADEIRRKVIAAGFGMLSLDALTAHVATRAKAGPKPVVHLKLRLEGEVTQECGVTLETFQHPISSVIELDIIEKARVTDEIAAPGEREFSLEDLDEPDVVSNGQIDLGQYVIEALGDAYDPFARKPGAVFDEPEPEREPSPFAILGKLKKDE